MGTVNWYFVMGHDDSGGAWFVDWSGNLADAQSMLAACAKRDGITYKIYVATERTEKDVLRKTTKMAQQQITQQVTKNGIGLAGAMFIVFLTLRLTDHIDWAWYWVASPLWLPTGVGIAAVAAFLMVFGAVYMVVWPFSTLARHRRLKRAQAIQALNPRNRRRNFTP